MMDLTPLDVRKKRGDFRKVFRGYDPDEVDAFLEMVGDRLESLVKENMQLRERAEGLQERVGAQTDREEAVREALVTAQELRRDVREQARREADLMRREAETKIEGILAEGRRRLEERREALEEMERMRLRFLKSFRALLERQLDAVEVEEGRGPLEDEALEIDFTVGDLRPSGADPDEVGTEWTADAPESVQPGPGEGGEAAEGPRAGERPRRPETDPNGAAAGAPEAEDEEALWLSSILEDEDESA